MSFHDPEADVAAAERRSQTRNDSEQRGRISLQAGDVDVRVENESPAGLFVVLDEALEVDVRWQTDEGERRSRARLKRVTTLPGQQSGWGLELIGQERCA
ncbi:hypothetical protein Poly30_18230 [Planctomycetes bacterium Poly30]|uniref:PilZ domain-containing protein n=1 Tax=Saltatorellus ferox TaxID=2528018 RepID=A0A518EQE3_9BACT|nr:hypothetical protein Poly30_18230 [Planctomycetes bacterium Poly30]